MAELDGQEQRRALVSWQHRNLQPATYSTVLEKLSREEQNSSRAQAKEQWRLPPDVSRAILKICKNSDLAVFMLLTALLKGIVHRYTQESLSTLVVPFYRQDEEQDGRYVLLQDELFRDQPLTLLAEQTRQTILRSYANVDLTLSDLFSQPLAEAVMRNNPLCLMTGLHGEGEVPAWSPLAFVFGRDGEELTCSTIYDAGRLRSELVATFCANFCAFATGAAKDFKQSIAAINIVPDSLAHWLEKQSAGETLEPSGNTLHGLFAAQVARTPEATALIFDDRLVNYAELDQSSDRVARALAAIGIGSTDRVALMVAPGPHAIAAILGILKAGACFVPLSTEEPQNRIQRLLALCEPELLVTDGPHPDRLGQCRVTPLNCLLENTVATEGAPSAPDTLGPCCMMFTSGSTGEPKRVTTRHSGIVNAVEWKVRTYGFKQGDRVLSLFQYVFDGFLLNLLAPLAAGAAVVLPTLDMLRRPRLVAECIARHRVTHLTAAPLLQHALFDAARPEELSSLRRTTFAGEAASAKTVRRAAGAGRKRVVSNEYGPAENSVVSTYCEELLDSNARVIGRPISNVRLSILDDDGNVLPPGMTGEIRLGGTGLNTEFTDSAAVSGANGCETPYRTGDLARWLPDGTIEYQGRRESNAKLRGQRIDLAEIERRLSVLEGVEDALAMIVGGSDSGMIGACVQMSRPLDTAALQANLRDDLPEYMIPAHIVQLEAFPLTEGGKLDRRRLREALESDSYTAEAGHFSNECERRLAAIWQRLLQVETVRPTENFFALGGHSIKAVEMLSEVYDEFGVDLPISLVFKVNTVRGLASAITDRLEEEPTFPQPGMRASAQSILSGAQERILSIAEPGRDAMMYNLPLLFVLEGEIVLPRLEGALRQLCLRHDMLRSGFTATESKWVQRTAPSCACTVERVELRDEDEPDVSIRATLQPFDLASPPLFKVTLFSLAGRHRFLLIDFHHSIIDEESLRIFFGELSSAYNGSELSRIPLASYAELTERELDLRTSRRYESELAGWIEKLRSVQGLEPLALPYDRHRPVRRCYAGAMEHLALSGETVRAIDNLCRDARASRFVFFVAAFSLLLSRYAQRPEIILGAPVSTRGTREMQSTIGLFQNTVPLLTVVKSDTSFAGLLAEVRDNVADDLSRGNVQFADIVKALGVERQYGVCPLFETVITMADSAATKLALDGVEAHSLLLHNGTAKFELTLEVDGAANRIDLHLEYSTERFFAPTIKRMLANFSTLLDDVLERPQVPLGETTFISGQERDDILRWGRSREACNFEPGSLADHFEEVVKRQPDAVAVVHGRQSLTYGELNARANSLARRIGVACRPGEAVAILCDRGIPLIVGIMAIQKAGGAHLPLDPAYPTVQTQRMLEGSGARVLLTNQKELGWLNFVGAVITFGDEETTETSFENPQRDTDPQQLAYILYTSGTTGTSNGVQIDQRNVVTMVRLVGCRFGVGSQDVFTQFHSVCFDVSVWEIFGSLLHGARLVLVPQNCVANPPAMLGLLRDHHVTMLCQPPSAFYLLAEEMVRTDAETTLKHVILGGEAIKMENLRQWSVRYGEPR
jgi:amino acid adenylation domain-containing protein